MTRTLRHVLAAAIFVCGIAAQGAPPLWQYVVTFDRGLDKKGQPSPPGKVYCWIPPQATTLRGVLITSNLSIEDELVADAEVRKACAENGIAILQSKPHFAGIFCYWKPGSTDTNRLLKILDDAAESTGRPEFKRVPWITAGHSTHGIYCRNVAYWQPGRVAGVLHIKSGNFHQGDVKPADASLAGVPMVVLNGHLETFGPEGGIRPELGRETQWAFAQKDIQKFRSQDENHLMSMLVEPGADHFHSTPETAAQLALFIRKTAKYRIPATLPAGNAPVTCLSLKAADGWLTDPDLKQPKNPPAAYKEYAGDKAAAMWHYDEEHAKSVVAFHRNLGNDQCLEGPVCAWLDDGDGWTFKAESKNLDVMPEKFGGSIGNKNVGHPDSPFVIRAKTFLPVEQTGPTTFRALRQIKNLDIAAYHPGDAKYRATVRWSGMAVPEAKAGKENVVEFPQVPDTKAGAGTIELKAKASSELPIYYEVEHGPVVVRDGKLVITDVPVGARYPIECRVTAYQPGKRTAPEVKTAKPVTVTFRLTAP